MKLFRNDPAGALVRERGIRANIASQLAELDRKRSELLLEDEVALVARHDLEVERLVRADCVHVERVEALEQAIRDQQHQDLERRKTAALAAFEKRLANRATAAARVEKALAECSESLKAYETSCRAPFDGWPSDLFPPVRQFWHFSSTNVFDRIASDDVLAMKGAARVRLTEIARRVGPLAEHDQRLTASLVETIKAAPLPDTSVVEEAAA